MSKWTKATYEMVARVVGKRVAFDESKRAVLALDFMAEFAADNPLFDKDRFLVAVETEAAKHNWLVLRPLQQEPAQSSRPKRSPPG